MLNGESVDELEADETKNYEETNFNNQFIEQTFQDPQLKLVQESVKRKALEQLALSEDSPFRSQASRRFESSQAISNDQTLREAQVQQETVQIRSQLAVVKQRLAELKLLAPQQNIETQLKSNGLNKQDKVPKLAHKSLPSPERADCSKSHSSETKFRPLTGKTDCPNCSCDRRSSICSLCNQLPTYRWSGGTTTASDKRPVVNLALDNQVSHPNKTHNRNTPAASTATTSTSWDERPIKPANNNNFMAVVEAVNDVVVPNRVYTISKSLNDKRTKLAQAIEELQLMMDKVNARGERLEQERKIVQLYRDQWKFGPNIGGPTASSRDRLNIKHADSGQERPARGYWSRLDPNLARDSNSLMGYQNVTSTLKLRQYDSRNKHKQSSPNTKRPWNSRPIRPYRSKSMDSIKDTNIRPSQATNQTVKSSLRPNPLPKRIKSTSETNLATCNTTSQQSDALDEDLEQDIEIEEVLDTNVEDEISGNRKSVMTSNVATSPTNRTTTTNETNTTSNAEKTYEKLTWEPVYGETEVKTVIKRAPKRKVTIIEPNSVSNFEFPHDQPSVKTLRQSSIMRRRQMVFQDQTITEARKVLDSASSLLESDKQDRLTKNQIKIHKTVVKPTARPISKAVPTAANNSKSNQAGLISTAAKRLGGATGEPADANNQERTRAIDLVMGANKEIARIEAMIREQRDLLQKLDSNQANIDRQICVSPITVCCSSPCHQHPSASRSSGSSQATTHKPNNSHSASGSSHKNLVITLRERLNKTKLRLARTLEEEKDKHHKLKQKFDSSLRKQSDLENENELLKQSLNRCIDTCLKDISSTFESLNETLMDSFGHQDGSQSGGLFLHSPTTKAANGGNGGAIVKDGSVLRDAALLLADNHHLKQMKHHIEAVESQRKGIFEELGKEKSRNRQLEVQLLENQAELNRLVEAKQRLETQLNLMSNAQMVEPVDKGPRPIVLPDCQPSTSNAGLDSSQSDQVDTTTWSKSSGSAEASNNMDAYRRFINSMSPDIESLRRERKLILSEFDNIKKILSDMDG